MLWIGVILNLILLFEYIFNSISNLSGKSQYITILIGLICVLFYLIPLINNFRKLKDKFFIINYILMAITATFYNPYIILLLISITFEYVYSKECKTRLYILLLLPLLCILKDIKNIPSNTIYMAFVLLIIFVNSKYKSDIIYLKKQRDKLREKNQKLNKNLEIIKSLSSKREYMKMLDERNSLSQKMHDKVGHTIAGSLMQLEAAKLIINSDRNKGMNMIDNVIDSLRCGMDDIRYTLRSIKPKVGEFSINEIKLILEEFSKSSNIKTFLIYNGDVDLIDKRIWLVIKDNLIEILTNVMKYSNANNFTIKIEVMNKLLRVEFKDDGKGCPYIEKGLGLSGIEERISNINGTVTFSGKNGFIINSIIKINT